MTAALTEFVKAADVPAVAVSPATGVTITTAAATAGTEEVEAPGSLRFEEMEHNERFVV